MISPATPDDIPALMAVERREGYETLVGRWSAADHAAEMARPGSLYLAARGPEGALEGFALLQGLDDPHDCATLRRIALDRPGEGRGRVLLAAVVDQAFQGTTHRLQLRVYPENLRARRAYDRAGFVAEGLLRDVSRQPDGRYRSMILMALLRPDREARAGR